MTVTALKKNNMAFKMKGSPMQRNFGISPVKNIFAGLLKKASPEKIEARKQLKKRAKKSGVSTFEQQKLDRAAARRAKSRAKKSGEKTKKSINKPFVKDPNSPTNTKPGELKVNKELMNIKVDKKKKVVDKKKVDKKKKVVKKYKREDDPVIRRHSHKFKKNIAPEEWKMKRRGQILKDYGVDLDYKNKKVKKKVDKKKKKDDNIKKLTTVGPGRMQAVDPSAFTKKS